MPKEIDFLIKGYKLFREHYFHQSHLLYDQLVREGQNPKVLMIACSDSRVDPAIVTRAEPGDLFVIRNVANLVPPYEEDNTYYHGTSAALEFGICGLGIRHVIVCGHSQCGGIRALLENPHQNISQIGISNEVRNPLPDGVPQGENRDSSLGSPSERTCFAQAKSYQERGSLLRNSCQNSFIQKWIQLAKPACDFVLKKYPTALLDEQIEICSQQSLIHSLDHLKSFPWIREKMQQKNLFLHAWYFDLSKGEIKKFDENAQTFIGL